ncbi:MAG: hypothetical protein ABIP89_19035 [Polyangiaceae bacterium]
MKRVSTILALTLLGLGCGPSFQAIYEGDARFEHCYALEEDPNVAMQYKSDCWKDWQKRYTYGQTRDRVQYAANRYAALTRAPASPTDEAMMGAAPGEEGEKTQLSAPAPTSAYTSPPKTSPGGNQPTPTQTWTTTTPVLDGGLAPSPVVTVPEPRGPLADCTDACTSTWKACRITCEQEKSGCDRCEKPYRGCLKSCMK